MRLHKKLAARGGDVKLAALDTMVARLIQVTGLDRVFQIYPNLDEALRAFVT